MRRGPDFEVTALSMLKECGRNEASGRERQSSMTEQKQVNRRNRKNVRKWGCACRRCNSIVVVSEARAACLFLGMTSCWNEAAMRQQD